MKKRLNAYIRILKPRLTFQINHSRTIGSGGSSQVPVQPIPNAKHLPRKPPSPAALNSLTALLEKSGKESNAIIAENRALRCQ